MLNALTEAVASSSAHGISRAVGTKATPLKLMWILLFLLFLVLFLKSGVQLAMKLRERKLTKVYHLDQVPFVFPDLYFCPNNPYSGSYPFVLSKAEANLINSRISRILAEYERMFDRYHDRSDASTRALFVQTSIPFELSARYLALRKEQSVLKSVLMSNFQVLEVDMLTFYHPENIVCFKANVTREMQLQMLSANSAIEFWLSTDPYFSELNYSGHPIQPIVDCINQTVPFLSWHPTSFVQDLKVSGYTMLIVAPGAYPSLRFETKFHLAPGSAYSVNLLMEENACSEELHRTHCTNEKQVKFTNPLTREPESFNYSSATCYVMRKNQLLTKRLGCQLSTFPMPWKYRKWPQCLNTTQLKAHKHILYGLYEMTTENVTKLEFEVSDYCKTRIPCAYNQYYVTHSFGKWPGAGSATEHFFANRIKFDQDVTPALARLSTIARQILAGNGSIHLKELFRNYLSESMISVKISAGSIMASQVVLTGAYSITDFLADIGGLLGLYIGCSLLTLCELLEVFYIILAPVLARQKPGRDDNDAVPDKNIATSTKSADNKEADDLPVA